MTEPLLDVEALRVGIGTDRGVHAVIDALNLSIAHGETLALVGTSGCGKSLTALSVMRLLPEAATVLQGRVRFGGDDLLRLPEHRMRGVRGRRIGMIFQDPSTALNPVLRVGVQIVEAIEAHTGVRGAAARAQAIDWLGRVGIPSPATRVDDHPHQFSGGQQQRVMIAIALAAEPALLIADEPTSSLDSVVQAHILDLLRDLQRERRLALLLVTHDLGLVSTYADRVALLHAGRIVEVAPVREFFAAPRHPHARALLQSMPDVDAAPASPTPCVGVARADDLRRPLLEVCDLRVAYRRPGVVWRRSGRDGPPVVDGVSFSLQPGDTLALIGESGCGKTTIGKAIAQLLRRDARVSGRILFDGVDLMTLRGAALRQARRDVQIVFQDPASSLDPRLCIADTLDETMRALRPEWDAAARRSRMLGLMAKVDLSADVLERHPHALSGGQRQRVAIARALCVEPRLIVCDEPTSALDMSVQAQVLDLLRTLQQDLGLTCLVITHDFAVVRQLARVVAVMDKGRIDCQGTVDHVFSPPRPALVERFWQALARTGRAKIDHRSSGVSSDG